MTGDFTIREARDDEATALSLIGVATFTEKFGHLYSADNLAAFNEDNHAPAIYAGLIADPASCVLVAQTPQGALAAYAVAGPASLPLDEPGLCDGEIKRLYVEAGHRGMGLGQVLFDRLLAWCEGQEFSGLYLSVYAYNEGAQRFYQRYGFDKIKEYEFLVGQHRDPEFIFKRKNA